MANKDNPVWAEKIWFDWESLPICVVSAEGLFAMKWQAGRDPDLLDIKMLGFEPQ